MNERIWRMSPDFWLLRFYLAVWGASPYSVNFCKFFWGLVFSPIALVLWALILAGRAFGAAVSWLGRATPRPVKTLLGLVVLIPSAVIGAAVVISLAALLGVAVYLWIVEHTGTLLFAGAVAIALLGLVYAGIVYGPIITRSTVLTFLASRADAVTRRIFDFVRRALRIAATPAEPIVGTTVQVIKGGGGVASAFYHSLKHATCPRVEVQGYEYAEIRVA